MEYYILKREIFLNQQWVMVIFTIKEEAEQTARFNGTRVKKVNAEALRVYFNEATKRNVKSILFKNGEGVRFGEHLIGLQDAYGMANVWNFENLCARAKKELDEGKIDKACYERIIIKLNKDLDIYYRSIGYKI